LKAYSLWEEALLLASARDSKLVGTSAQPHELMSLPFITAPRQLVRRELEDAQLRACGIDQRNVILEFGHPESQKVPVKRDLGLCFFLESSIRQDVARGELRIVETPGIVMSIPLFLVRRKDKVLSPFQLALMEHIMASRPPPRHHVGH